MGLSFISDGEYEQDLGTKLDSKNKIVSEKNNPMNKTAQTHKTIFIKIQYALAYDDPLNSLLQLWHVSSQQTLVYFSKPVPLSHYYQPSISFHPNLLETLLIQ